MQNLNRSGWWIVLGLVFAGLAVSGYLTYLHFLTLKNGFATSFCNVNEYLNCNLVLASRFSTIRGIPLAGLGVVYYLYLFGALLYARLAPDTAEENLRFPYITVLFSAVLSLLLAVESFFFLNALCLFCSTLYVINLALAATFRKVHRMKWFAKPSQNSLAYFSIVFLVGILLLYSSHRNYAQEIKPEQLKAYLQMFPQQEEVKLETAGRPSWGNPQAKIKVVEFSDFECPHCQRAAFTLKTLLMPYKNDVQLVFLNYPLDSSCNAAIKGGMHQQACNVATASYCAGQQGKFWEYHDQAFKRMPRYSAESLKSIAEKLKLDTATWQACLSAESTRSEIQKDIAQGSAAKLEGTPAVFVNGKSFQLWMLKEAWAALIPQLKAQN